MQRGWAIDKAAPALAALLLGAMVAVTAARGSRTYNVDEYMDRVRTAIERTPYQIGDWAGKDVEPPPAAQKLLKPNKILQRRYTDTTTGRTVSLLIVHCADVRDMLGHFPPVCYPAHGWSATEESATSVSLNGSAYPARRYDFRRSAQGVEQTISILGFFVVPNPAKQIVADMASLNQVWQLGPGMGLGAGQVQVVADERMPEADRAEVERRFLRALEPVVRVIATGATDAKQ